MTDWTKGMDGDLETNLTDEAIASIGTLKGGFATQPDRPSPGGPYPEHEKMLALGERKQEIQEFLDWLDTQRGEKGDEPDQSPWELMYYDVYLCEPQDVRLTKEQIMARYFGIDLDAISREKGWMLDDIRAMQGER